jgi:hypothetical protein
VLLRRFDSIPSHLVRRLNPSVSSSSVSLKGMLLEVNGQRWGVGTKSGIRCNVRRTAQRVQGSPALVHLYIRISTSLNARQS